MSSTASSRHNMPAVPIVKKNEQKEVRPTETERIHGRAKLGLFRAVRYTLEVPNDNDDSGYELHVNGFGAAKPSYRDIRAASAQSGQISVSTAVDRGTPFTDLLQPRKLCKPEEFERDSVLAVAEDIDTRFGLAKVKLRGHSMGGRAAVAAAEEAPNYVTDVTLVNAAGLEEHNLATLLSRIPTFLVEEIAPNRKELTRSFGHTAMLMDFIGHNLQNPLRTLFEGVDIARADIRDRVRTLGANGVRIAIIDTAADRLIPNTTVESDLGSEVAHYKRLSHPRIGHLGPQLYPEVMTAAYREADEATEKAQKTVYAVDS